MTRTPVMKLRSVSRQSTLVEKPEGKRREHLEGVGVDK